MPSQRTTLQRHLHRCSCSRQQGTGFRLAWYWWRQRCIGYRDFPKKQAFQFDWELSGFFFCREVLLGVAGLGTTTGSSSGFTWYQVLKR